MLGRGRGVLLRLLASRIVPLQRLGAGAGRVGGLQVLGEGPGDGLAVVEERVGALHARPGDVVGGASLLLESLGLGVGRHAGFGPALVAASRGAGSAGSAGRGGRPLEPEEETRPLALAAVDGEERIALLRDGGPAEEHRPGHRLGLLRDGLLHLDLQAGDLRHLGLVSLAGLLGLRAPLRSRLLGLDLVLEDGREEVLGPDGLAVEGHPLDELIQPNRQGTVDGVLDEGLLTLGPLGLGLGEEGLGDDRRLPGGRGHIDATEEGGGKCRRLAHGITSSVGSRLGPAQAEAQSPRPLRQE